MACLLLQILTPGKGELLEISTRTRAYPASISADAYTSLAFSKVGGAEVAFVDGAWDIAGVPMIRDIRGAVC